MTRQRQKTIKHIASIATLYVVFFAFLFTTDPNKLAIGWLLVPFALLFAAIFLSILYIQGRKRQVTGRYSPKRVITAAIVAAIPTFLLLLDSINQLTLRDALIFAVFSIVTLFYIRRLSFERAT